MSVLDDGNNLPAVLIDIEGEISSDFDQTQWGTTSSVLVIGTAFSGTPDIATKVYNTDMARYYYGSAYDNTTHRSASLVAGVQDAYERGCRTIYAMRVGGKDLYKDFKFCDGDSNLRLRVQSLYPSNVTKQCYVFIDTRSGEEKIVLYKPAEKATVREKKEGKVDSANALIIKTFNLNQDNGLGQDDKLTELLDVFNKDQTSNNVLRMSVVDADGNTVTNTPAAQELRIGSLFSGVYFIGRNDNKVDAYTLLSTNAIINADDIKPYSSYTGKFFKTITFNSDVNSDYPIYTNKYEDMQELLKGVSVTTTSNYDFLGVAGVVDRAWAKDSVDYEEVDLSKFEIYKRLGSGFAITAHAVQRKDSNGNEKVPRIAETPVSDSHHVAAINDGIYSLLQNAEVDYRVLVAGNADDKIADKLPKASAFKIATANSVHLLGEVDPAFKDKDHSLIIATPKVAEDDMTAVKSYQFQFNRVDESSISIPDLSSKLYVTKIATMIAGVDEDTLKNLIAAGVPDNTRFAVFASKTAKTSASLVKVVNGVKVPVNNPGLKDELFDIDDVIFQASYTSNTLTLAPIKTSSEDGATSTPIAVFDGKDYMLVENKHTVFVAKVDATDKTKVHPLGTMKSMLSTNDDETLVYVEDEYGRTNKVIISTAAGDFMSLDEFAALLNDDPTLGDMFSFTLTDEGVNSKELYLDDIEKSAKAADTAAHFRFFDSTAKTPVDGIVYPLEKNKTITYDYNKYIPYRTSDTFARQLAQHCAYTSMLTRMTHGIIGFAPITNLTLAGVANHVDHVLSTDFSLYARKPTGRMLLGADGEPYEIGDRISVTVFQHDIVDDSNVTISMNGAAAYAGLVSTLPLSQSSTMQAINITSIDYSLSNSQLQSLSNSGFVTVRYTDTKGLCVVDGVTQAPSSQLRRRLSVERIINEVGRVIRVSAESYIGKNNTIVNRNALKTAIDSALHDLKGTLINDYEFHVLNLNSYTTDSYISIAYRIVPINEIRSVDNSIKVVRTLENS